MLKYPIFSSLIVLCCLISSCHGVSSPITPFVNYTHTVELQVGIADLWWTTNDTAKEITFELHVNTTGWIALGVSPAGGMAGADIGTGWVDSTGKVFFQDRHAFAQAKPVVDNTTQDWFVLQGREQNGWTAIQFKRAFDTCDVMDYPIKSGTNHLIFAFGLVDPDPSQPGSDITYHEDRRGSRTLPLRSYNDPPSEDKFAGLDTFEWRSNDYLIPPVGTTYHCKIFKAPTQFATKRHAVAYKMMIDQTNVQLIHHLLVYECDPTSSFDDNNLPDGTCDDIGEKVQSCSSNIATGWAVGGDYLLEFPEEAGYPVGGNFPIKYYLLETHYNNPSQLSGRRDNTGIRFYLGNQLRQHDLGFLTFGASSFPLALAIPPHVEKFIVDAYCPSNASQSFPASGITVTAAFPHTHLQGNSVWTKVIRNNTAVEYLFNADEFDFNYQFNNLLPKRTQLYPGDEFATRCIYQTKNKDNITVGGISTTNEMCLHMFTYFPRLDNYYMCGMMINMLSWQKIMKSPTVPSYGEAVNWLLTVQWTPEFAAEFQEFYNTAARDIFYGGSSAFQGFTIPTPPVYKDLEPDTCPNKTRIN